MSYQPGKDRNMIAAIKRAMEKAWFGEAQPVEEFAIPVLADNNEFLPVPTFAQDAPVPMIGVSPGNISYIPFPTPVTCNILANANMVNTRFFISDSYYRISGIRFNYKTAGTIAGCTAQITVDTLGNGAANSGSQAPGTGRALLATPIDLVGSTVDRTQTLTLVNAQQLYINPGDSLSIAFSGTTTTLAGVEVTVDLVNTTSVGYNRPVYQPALQPPFKTIPSNVTSIYTALNASLASQVMFIANRDMTVVGAYLTYGTAFASSITIDLTKDTGTQAAGAGSSILASPFAVTTANPGLLLPPTGLSLTLNRTNMLAGDRISIKYSATTTGTGVCLTLVFAPLYDRLEISLPMGPNAADKVSQYFFIANRNYEVIDASCVFGVAAGSASTAAVTIDKQSNAPGTGNIVQTDNANAGFDLNATANTVQFMTPAALRLRLMSVGDRLGLLPAGAAVPANTCITVSLRQRS